MDTAKHLIERIESNPLNERVGVLSNDLLREFHRGLPLSHLKHMLESTNNDVVAVAIWITSELGERCRPLLSTVTPLLGSPLQRIRFWALDCLIWASPDSGCDIVRGIELIDDPESGIRRKVLDLLFRLSTEQLKAALSCSEESQMNSSVSHGLHWLLSDDALLPGQIMNALRGPDSNLRKYAAVAAARFSGQDKESIRFAATMDDADIAKFALRVLGD